MAHVVEILDLVVMVLYLYIMVLKKKYQDGEKSTTNNKMEIVAVIRGLEMLKEPCKVTVYSDSAYVVNTIDKGWIYNCSSS